jgi:hypothetical protein
MGVREMRLALLPGDFKSINSINSARLVVPDQTS